MPRSSDDIYDEWLILRCQDGERAALDELVGRWQGRLERHAWRLTRREDAARDVAQEAWMAIVRGLRGLRDSAGFRAWAYRIVANKSADHVRRRQRERRRHESIALSAPVECDCDSKRHDRIDMLRAALKQLPTDEQALVALHYVDGLGVAELARVYNVPVGTIKSRLHRARGELRTVMESEYHEQS